MTGQPPTERVDGMPAAPGEPASQPSAEGELADQPLEERPTEPLPVQAPAAVPSGRGLISRRWRRRWGSRATYFIAGAGIVALLFSVGVVLAQLGEFMGLPGNLTASPAPDEASAAGGSADEPTAAAPEGDCPAQELRAAADGSWRMATRRGDIQLRSQGRSTSLVFRVYRGGSADGAAQVTAQVLPRDEVEARFGVQPPDTDQALVVVFSEHFRASGNSWALGRVGAVDRLVLSDVDEGLIAVAGLRGSRCFELSADGFDEDESGKSAAIIIDIGR